MSTRLRRTTVAGAGLVLLAGPAALAFFAGGYFDTARVWAGLGAAVLAVLAVLLVTDIRLRGRAVALAFAGLAGLAAWTLVSLAWAPIAATAYASAERLVLYLSVLVASTLLLRARPLARAAVPGLAGGALVVVGYGISERLLPGVLQFAHSTSAGGRLEQPLTYWNAMGELAAIGLVLGLACAGDTTRDPRLRCGGLAACAPLGLGLYLSFSRGALFAAVAGVVTLVLADRSRAQARAAGAGMAAALLAALAAAPFGSVTGLSGTLGTRERAGAVVLLGLVIVMAAAALLGRRMFAREPAGELRLPRHVGRLAVLALAAGLVIAVAAGAKEQSGRRLSGGANRLSTLQSDRYDYWRVAGHAFIEQPVRGVGAGGWAVQWLRHRPYDVGAADAHSLPLQTAAELGVVGLLLLGALLWGVAEGAARAVRIDRVAAVGPLAGVVAYLAHSPLDWDWEMPALTAVAVVLAGALLAQSSGGAEASAAPRGRLPRALLLAPALLATLWFAVQARSLHEQAVVRSVLHAEPVFGPARGDALDRRIDQARFLNPDRQIDLLYAYVQVHLHHFDRAVRLAEQVAAEEPQNPAPWLVLQFIAGSSAVHGNLYRQAAVQLRRLAPPVPPPR